MMTAPMQWFCRKSGKSKYTAKDIAALKAADRNPYSWNMEFYEYPDGSGYEGRFTKCGIGKGCWGLPSALGRPKS